jgi:hypothetical protein
VHTAVKSFLRADTVLTVVLVEARDTGDDNEEDGDEDDEGDDTAERDEVPLTRRRAFGDIFDMASACIAARARKLAVDVRVERRGVTGVLMVK